MRKLRALLVLALMVPALSACGSLAMLSAPQVNLAASSYGAADMLIQQAQARLSQNTVLALGALQDLKAPHNQAPSNQAPLGRLIASQVGARFVQLGYNVHIPDDIGTVSAGEMPASPATPVLKAPLSPATPTTKPGTTTGTTVGNTQAMLTGHYARSGQELLVNIRLVDMGAGKIWGSYDYTIPLSNEILEMMTPPPAPAVNGGPAENRGFFDF